MEINYLIVENERFAREQLHRVIRKLRPSWHYAGFSETIADTVSILSNDSSISLVFLDIELDDGPCFEIFNQIDTDVSVIFTTAYSEFALKAFKLNSIDYLLKPVAEAEIEAAIIKFEKQQIDTSVEVSPYTENKASLTSRILIQNGNNYGYINIADIAYFVSEDKYVFAVYNNGERSIVSFPSLKSLEDVVDSNCFFRVRRNILLSINSIKSVGKFFKGRLMVTISVGDKEEMVIVNSVHRAPFLNWLGSHR
jgi:DNA-binding LytR/AlgR family response regulator